MLVELVRNFSQVAKCKINTQNQKHFCMPKMDENITKNIVYDNYKMHTINRKKLNKEHVGA